MSDPEIRKPTIRDVAKFARVGVMTVSRVMNNHPGVRTSTRKKVESAIVSLGYEQNEAARLMKGQRAKTIGLIVPDLSDQFFALCAHTVQHIARSLGYMTLVVASERDAELEYEQAALMAARKVSGLLIVTSSKAGDMRLQSLLATGLEIVALDRPLPGCGTDCVLVENRAGAEEAVQLLMVNGHRRIACIGYDEEVYTIYERVQGYKASMHAAGLEPRVMLGLLTLEQVQRWVKEVMAEKQPPTAVFSLNHRTSVHLVQALALNKIRVPEQLAVVGFDEFDMAGMLASPLTTVAQSAVDLSRRAMALLFKGISEGRAGDDSTPAKVLLPTRLIVRASSGPHDDAAD